jgi:NAD(P)-dependent dehydrogenase (short-subunit alcohol dehydrogenase family)
LDEATESIVSEGGTALPIAADVRDPQAMRDVISTTVERFGHIDYLFNNAGLGLAGEVEEFTKEHWDRMIDVNIRGVINGIAAAYPMMIRQRSGHIVNTSSLAGLAPAPLMTPYATTKHAIVGLSLALRPEAAIHGVRVSVVCPGFVDTPMLDGKGLEGLKPSHLADSIDFRQEATGLRPPYPPDRLARAVLAGISKNRPVIIAPRGLHALWVLHRLFPMLQDRLSPRTVARIRNRAASTAPIPAPVLVRDRPA